MTQRFSAYLPLASAAAAVIGGCALLLLIGAPAGMPVMNFAALLIGGVSWTIIVLLGRVGVGRRAADLALLAAGLSVPLTALLGPEVDGVSRWLVVSGLTVQPAVIAVPLIALAFALRPSELRATTIGIASLGVGLQPDPAAAAMLFLGALACLIARRASALAWAATGLAGAGLAAALLRATPLPPVPFVEDVLSLALQSGLAAIGVALATLLMLFMPAFLPGPGRSRVAAMVFAGVWLGAIASALVGNYPTPVIGFGGSAVLGYVLSVGLLGKRQADATVIRQPSKGSNSSAGSVETLRFT